MKNKQECGVIKFFFVFLQAVKAFESKVLNKRIMAKKRLWSREEFIVVLNLYYKLPFGKLNHTTKEVKELAALIGRTDNSVAMRLSNFAACDPYILSSGRHGLEAGRQQCLPYWKEFNENREALLFESERILAQLENSTIDEKFKAELNGLSNLQGEDKVRAIKTRVNQSVFRTIILSNYSCKCALTGIDIPELLVASHIKPWAMDEKERSNPENGICLSSLYDSAFDKGLIGFDQEYKVVLSPHILEQESKGYFEKHFGSVNHLQLAIPEEYKPNKSFLEWHMDTIFQR
uniref:HNH endonuclease n=1 Tax=Prevotella sp. TaxID=59823 RepID=UPI00402766F4